MKRDMSTIFIAATDMFLCVLAVVIVAVNPPTPIHAGVEMKAEYLIRASWPVKDYDADIDLYLATPHSERVYFSNRQVGCTTLDTDNKGWNDSLIPQSDGSYAVSSVAVETIAIRCLDAGHYDAAVNFFGYASHANEIPTRPGKRAIPVHVWIEKVNPKDEIVFQADLILNSENPRESINFASFDLGRDGVATFVAPPLMLVPQR